MTANMFLSTLSTAGRLPEAPAAKSKSPSRLSVDRWNESTGKFDSIDLVWNEAVQMYTEAK